MFDPDGGRRHGSAPADPCKDRRQEAVAASIRWSAACSPPRTPRPRPGPSAAASGRIPDPALPAPQGAQDHRPDRPRRVRGRAPPRASVPMSFIGREAKALPAFCLGKTPVSGNPAGRVSGALDGSLPSLPL